MPGKNVSLAIANASHERDAQPLTCNSNGVSCSQDALRARGDGSPFVRVRDCTAAEVVRVECVSDVPEASSGRRGGGRGGRCRGGVRGCSRNGGSLNNGGHLIEGGGGGEGQSLGCVGSGHSLSVVACEGGDETQLLGDGLLNLESLRRVRRIRRSQSGRGHSCHCLGAELGTAAD